MHRYNGEKHLQVQKCRVTKREACSTVHVSTVRVEGVGVMMLKYSPFSSSAISDTQLESGGFAILAIGLQASSFKLQVLRPGSNST